MEGTLIIGFGVATVVSVILGVALFRDVLARRLLNVGIDVTGDTYSQDQYDKKVKALGWAWVGFVTTWFGFGFTVAVVSAPPEIHSEVSKLLPYALTLFAVGFTLFIASMFLSIRVKAVRCPVEDLRKIEAYAKVTPNKQKAKEEDVVAS